MKYIFVSGGVVSGLGKGVTTAAISMLLQARGYTVSPVKVDMYMNIDSGTLRPSEHGEVFVTDDGIETDQDIGIYERFLNRSLNRWNYITLGQIFQEVIRKERSLEYDGATVDFIPHVTDEIIRRINKGCEQSDFVVVELGGTVGEYKNAIFYEAARLLKLKEPHNVCFIHVVYIPFLAHIGELKTKPAQTSVHMLNGMGIFPDFLVARAEKPLDKPRRDRLSLYCAVPEDHVIENLDVLSIYEIPMLFEKQGFSDKLLAHFSLSPHQHDLVAWKSFYVNLMDATDSITVGLVGKYFSSGDYILSDSYISVIEAIKHASSRTKIHVEQVWINAEEVSDDGEDLLSTLHGILIPQGWGSRGSEGKIRAIRYARERAIPYLGLCYGMQMAVVEFARHVLGWQDAHSAEVNPSSSHPVIHIMNQQKEYLAQKQYGGTIRLGSWPCVISPGTQLYSVYSSYPDRFISFERLCEQWPGVSLDADCLVVYERHRHRYEFNTAYRSEFERHGFVISGTSPDGALVEAIEVAGHPFFIGTQFHPEFISRPLDPHPLFIAFLQAALCCKRH